MSFSSDINKFVKNAKKKLETSAAEHEEQAKAKLIDVMGDDLNTITSITFDLESGKFKYVQAPERAKDKLRQAGLIIE